MLTLGPTRLGPWTIRQLRGELAARKIEARGFRVKSTFVDRLRQDDRETLAREQAECPACQEVERVAIYGGFAHCDRHRCGASGPGRGGAGDQSPPVPSAPPVSAAQALSFGAAPSGSIGSSADTDGRYRGARAPTEQQWAYVEDLVERYGLPRPPAGWSRGRISRWIDEVRAGRLAP